MTYSGASAGVKSTSSWRGGDSVKYFNTNCPLVSLACVDGFGALTKCDRCKHNPDNKVEVEPVTVDCPHFHEVCLDEFKLPKCVNCARKDEIRETQPRCHNCGIPVPSFDTYLCPACTRALYEAHGGFPSRLVREEPASLSPEDRLLLAAVHAAEEARTLPKKLYLTKKLYYHFQEAWDAVLKSNGMTKDDIVFIDYIPEEG